MSRIHKFSDQLVDYGERLSKMADAAEGKHRHTGRRIRGWVILPAAGAGLYALVRSDFFSRQAREVVDEAKSRAADLPDDLMTRVHEATNGAPSGPSRSGRRNSQPASRRKSASAGKARRSRATGSTKRAKATR
jgi:hypothetical protein